MRIKKFNEFGIILERISLTYSEKKKVDDIILRIIKEKKNNSIPEKKFECVGVIEVKKADGKLVEIAVFLDNDKDATENGYYVNNKIIIQQVQFENYFKDNTKSKISKFITGNDKFEVCKELLRKTIVHELIHAKDPYKKEKKDYDDEKDSDYFSSWREFQSMTGQFFESIDNNIDLMVRKWRENGINKDESVIAKVALTDILNVFSGKKRKFDQSTYDYIGRVNRNIFQKITTAVRNFIYEEESALYAYNYYVMQIKKYHPEAWNTFLKNLFKTIDRAKEKIDNQLSILDDIKPK